MKLAPDQRSMPDWLDSYSQDHQHPVVALLHLAQRLLVVLVQGSGCVTGYHQNSAPDNQVEPNAKGHFHVTAKHCGIRENEQHDQNDAGDRGKSSVTPSKVICGIQGRQEIEDQSHALRRDQKIQHRSNQHQEQQ